MNQEILQFSEVLNIPESIVVETTRTSRPKTVTLIVVPPSTVKLMHALMCETGVSIQELIEPIYKNYNDQQIVHYVYTTEPDEIISLVKRHSDKKVEVIEQ